jgi:hypothetical protein
MAKQFLPLQMSETVIGPFQAMSHLFEYWLSVVVVQVVEEFQVAGLVLVVVVELY